MTEPDSPSTSSEFVFYQREDGRSRIQVRLDGGTVWLTQVLMAELFQTTKQNISLHIKNIFTEGELDPSATVKKYLTVQIEGNRQVQRAIDYYNLDVILAVGYRVRSHRGTQFRRWATELLREYVVKGFVLDDERLKEGRTLGADYFDELLERIREIRASEKRFYQKICQTSAARQVPGECFGMFWPVLSATNGQIEEIDYVGVAKDRLCAGVQLSQQR